MIVCILGSTAGHEEVTGYSNKEKKVDKDEQVTGD